MGIKTWNSPWRKRMCCAMWGRKCGLFWFFSCDLQLSKSWIMTKPIRWWLTVLEKFYDWWISTRNISLAYHHSLRFQPRNEALTESTRIFFLHVSLPKATAMVKPWKIFMVTSPFFGERIRFQMFLSESSLFLGQSAILRSSEETLWLTNYPPLS